jgi:peroxiredoxin 6
MPFWEERGVKPIALSCDDVDSHKGWLADIAEYNGGQGLTYPIIADPTRYVGRFSGCLPACLLRTFMILWCLWLPCARRCGILSDLSVLLGMLDKELKDELGMPLTVRKVFVIGPDRKVKVILTYPPMYGSWTASGL